MDGLMYSAISKNLANGIGTFWNPYLSETLFPEFHEHPPLVRWYKKDLYTLPAGRTAAAKYTGLAYITIDAVTILCGFTGQLAAGPRPPV